ncbi:MAG: NADP-dependent phosphogluconate dehydrogenase [Solirubrobacterales bacterium]|nr:NADP-dependent phosphogluconate dehydrogenase [Solirubrobacterales bacterium]MBV9049780.1 NADP-dependent phosphogluconate dehydrogenase [Solirubrobacterales bacterium]
MTSSEKHFGLTGLATMGANLARNVAHHDIPVAVHNRTTSRMQKFMDEHDSEGPLTGHDSVEEWIAALARPRVLMSMVQAGAATDAVIDEIAPKLDGGDVLIDGGNANFRDTQRRHAALAEQGIHFLGVGVSGGEEGALNGPSIMPGGDREPYDESVKRIFEAIAAQVDGTPCCTYVGADGAGHYVKMVHNGIEYADMQLIAESYDLLRHGVGLEVPEIAQRFKTWNESELESFLIEIAARVLSKTDDATGKPLVDVILDAAEQKGTGRWTAENALELGVPLTGITEAVFARTLSALKQQREAAADRLAGPTPSAGGDQSLAEDLEHALYASKIVSYAQGFAQMAAAADDEGWDIHLGSMATIWRGGCIIRARFLDRIREAYDEQPRLANLMLADFFAKALEEAQDPWRRVVARAAEMGIPTPAFSSSLAYYDGYRRARGPASLIQGLRDLFGAHTYHRSDREGTFHIMWGEDGREIEA